jgi:hypothetical protein
MVDDPAPNYTLPVKDIYRIDHPFSLCASYQIIPERPEFPTTSGKV